MVWMDVVRAGRRAWRLWVEVGTGRGRAARGGQLGPPELSPGGPRVVHGSAAFIHRPGSDCPQSCPQMWVKCARTTTLGDRAVTPGW